MSFLSDLFKRKPQEPEPPRTRLDMEDDLKIQYDASFQLQTPNGVLNQVFKQSRPPQESEKKLLKEMFDVISSVPQGQMLLDDVAKNGYSFFFEASSGQNDGCMYGDQKKIMICPCQHSSVAAMAATAVHEMTHALQNERTNGAFGISGARINMADQFKFQRAAEAAAWTEEAKFAYQIRDRHPEVENHVSQFPMYNAFVAEMDASGDMAKAGEAAFKTWYGFKYYQEVYEKNHVSCISYNMDQAYARQKDILSESLPSDQLLNQMFVSDDVKKNIPPEYLTSKEAFSLSNAAFNQLNSAASVYNTGKADSSLNAMYSYDTGLTYSAANTETKEAVAASVRPQRSVMESLKRINDAARSKKRTIAALAQNRSANH